MLAGAWRHTAWPGLGRAGARAGAGLGHLLVVVPPLLPDAPRAAGALAAPTLASVTILACDHHTTRDTMSYLLVRTVGTVPDQPRVASHLI